MIYLNNAATSYPKPLGVIEAVTNCIKSIPFHSSRTGLEQNEEDIVGTCRKNLAKLFHIQNPQRIFFSSGSTESLNLALLGLDNKDKHIVTTAIEHNSVYRPLKTLEKDGVISLTIIDCDETGYVEAGKIREAVRENTCAVVVNHCSNVTGTVLNLYEIAEAAHTVRDCTFIVDASQSAGAVPVNVEKDNIDILVFTGHKSIFGLPGIGGIYIKQNIKVKPLKTGGTGVRSDLLYQPEEPPLYYEAGTQNIPGIVSLNAGLTFIEETGFDQIKKKKSLLMREIYDGINSIPGTTIYSGQKNSASVLSFNMSGILPDDIGYMLEHSFGIIVRSGLHCAPLIHKSLGSHPHGSVRVSPSYFNSNDDIRKLIEAIEQIRHIA